MLGSFQIDIGDIVKGSNIGGGVFGQVYECTYTPTPDDYLVVKVQRLSEKDSLRNFQ